MIKIILFILLFAQTSFALSKSQYERGLFESPIARRDNRPVQTKKHPSLEATLVLLHSLKDEINSAGRAFGVDPMHIAGAIAGEHALNVDWVDSAQNANIKRRMNGASVDAAADRALFTEISLPTYGRCQSIRGDYDFWYCIVNAWYQKKHGGIISFFTPQNNSYKEFTYTYFNPNGLGKTFGFGQLSPLRALMVSDMVSNATNIPRISFRVNGNSHQAYSDLFDERKVVYYVAATIRKSIDAYAEIARFDISRNPGVVATLYNIGNERFHANNRLRENLRRIDQGQSIRGPESNSLGRWVLQHQDLIQNIFR